MTGFTYFVCVCFTLNYVIGSGFLTLPWAFDVAGVALASVVLTLVSALSLLTCWKVLEALARAQRLEALFGPVTPFSVSSNSGRYGAVPSIDDLSTKRSASNDVEMTVISAANDGKDTRVSTTSTSDGATATIEAPLELGNRKFEVAELCSFFLGPLARKAYIFSISLYFYGCLWAYSTVFANAWSGWLPLPGLSSSASYYAYLALWAVIECTWCLFELDEQISMQVALAGGRVLMLAMMIGTVLSCDVTHNDSFDLPDQGARASEGAPFAWWEPSKLYIILPICFYANLMHHSVPGIVAPVLDKTQAKSIFKTAFCCTYTCYLLLALVVSTYFGRDSNPSSNLNWIFYKGFAPSAAMLARHHAHHPPEYATLITIFVVIFPSLDVASAFPLNAVTLGNNFLSTWYSGSSAAAAREAEQDFKTRSMFRLVAAVPPIVMAGIVHDLGPITAFTGLTGVVIALVVPAALSLASERAMEARGLGTATVFTVPGTTGAFNIIIAAAGGLSVAYILFFLFTEGVPSALT